MANILVVDDDLNICGLLEDVFEPTEHTVSTAHNIADTLAMAKSMEFDVVFLDVKMPDGNGLDIMPNLRRGPGQPEVVIMTGFGSPDGAEMAIASGAWDYFQKPPSINQFLLTFERALQYREQKSQVRTVVCLDRTGMVGESSQIRECLDMVAKCAGTDASVLVTGETGTGKEVFARALHRNSPRSEAPFVVVDCASLPENLLSSFLFGHVKGAFTGADRDTEGLIKQADKGTLFLDEIGELPLDMQKVLLRVLQEKRFRPVGGGVEQTSDFRLLAATNRDLEALVEGGGFREDLYFRLKTFQITVPPLRERREDIPLLVASHLSKLFRRYDIAVKGINQDFLQVLEEHDWPGNVRELLNVLEVSVVEAGDSHNLFAIHLPRELRAQVLRGTMAVESDDPVNMEITEVFSRNDGKIPSLKDYRAQVADKADKIYLQHLLERAGNDISNAMRIAGLGKSSMYNLLKKHNISLKTS